MKHTHVANLGAFTAFLDALRRARCVLLRRSVETEMHLAARILLPFGLPEKKVETTAQSHTHPCIRFVECVCVSVYLYLPARCCRHSAAAVSGCLDDLSTSSSPTNTLLQQVLLVFTPLPRACCTPPTTTAEMFWEIPRIFAAYWDRPSVDTVRRAFLVAAI